MKGTSVYVRDRKEGEKRHWHQKKRKDSDNGQKNYLWFFSKVDQEWKSKLCRVYL